MQKGGESLYQGLRPIVTVANCNYHVNLVFKTVLLEKYLLNKCNCTISGRSSLQVGVYHILPRGTTQDKSQENQ